MRNEVKNETVCTCGTVDDLVAKAVATIKSLGDEGMCIGGAAVVTLTMNRAVREAIRALASNASPPQLIKLIESLTMLKRCEDEIDLSPHLNSVLASFADPVPDNGTEESPENIH